jgi:hypothetical protein
LMCHVGFRGRNGTGFGPDDVCTVWHWWVAACFYIECTLLQILSELLQDAFNESVDREHEMKCISSPQLCSLTSSTIVSFSHMLSVILAWTLCLISSVCHDALYSPYVLMHDKIGKSIIFKVYSDLRLNYCLTPYHDVWSIFGEKITQSWRNHSARLKQHVKSDSKYRAQIGL